MVLILGNKELKGMKMLLIYFDQKIQKFRTTKPIGTHTTYPIRIILY